MIIFILRVASKNERIDAMRRFFYLHWLTNSFYSDKFLLKRLSLTQEKRARGVVEREHNMTKDKRKMVMFIYSK